MKADVHSAVGSRRSGRSLFWVWLARVLAALGALALFQLANPAGAGPDDGTISGEVYVAANPHEPVAGAKIGLFQTLADGSRGPWIRDVATAADGSFELTVTADLYTLTFVAPEGDGFVDNRQGFLDVVVTVEPGRTEAVDAALLPDDEFLATVGGHVLLDGDPLAPVAGLGVGLFHTLADGSRGPWIGDASTGANGGYTFSVLPGSYTLTFIAPNGERFAANGSSFLDRTASVGRGETAVLDADLEPGATVPATLAGRMYHAGDPQRVAAGALVDVFQTNADGSRGPWIFDTRTDTEGVYEFSLDPGTFTLTFIAPTGATFVEGDSPYLNRTVTLSEGESVNVDAQLASDEPDQTAGRVEGEMYIDSEPATPVGGERVEIFEAMADGSRGSRVAETQTASDGSYAFVLEADAYVVMFTAPSGMTFVDGDTTSMEQPIDVASGATVELNAIIHATPNPGPDPDPDLERIDWWGCWLAAEARNAAGQTPQNGQTVASLPNCASGPSSAGSEGNMSHPSAPPIFRPTGANGNPSIEFTFDANTLLQTNGGQPWSSEHTLAASSQGVTLAWVGMMTDVNSHNVKYLVTGLDGSSEHPMLLVEGEGPNRFLGYGGGATEARSSNGTVLDNTIHGVILYLAPNGSASIVEVDGVDVRNGQDSSITSDIDGLTLGNIFSRGFSTTDHQFVFLGMHEGQLSSADKAVFWSYVDGL